MNDGSIVNRHPASHSLMEGFSPQLNVLPSPPPGPIIYPDETFGSVSVSYAGLYTGQLVAVQRGPSYVELYCFIEPFEAGIENVGLEGWKKVDLDWPKIDPNTGKPHDQYLEWYSPLAE